MKHGSTFRIAMTKGEAYDSFERRYKTSSYDYYGQTSWDLDPSKLGFDPRMGYWIRVKCEGVYDFTELLELQSYPFDVQDFTIWQKLK